MDDVIERIAVYLSRREKSRGIDKENIHGFDVGPDCGVELLASDLRKLLAEAAAMRRERDELRISLAEAMQQGRDTQDRLTARQAECRALAARLAEIERQQPVAVIGETYSLLWAQPWTMPEIVRRCGIKVGSLLYTLPAPAATPEQPT